MTPADLAKKRAYDSEATKKYRQKMYEEAATGNPEAVERYENYLAAPQKKPGIRENRIAVSLWTSRGAHCGNVHNWLWNPSHSFMISLYGFT